MLKPPFVPIDFSVPTVVDEPDFVLKKLTTGVVKLDYDAVMSSKQSLRKIFNANDTWPTDDMTLDDNYNDLRMHQTEFDKREAFAYTVLSSDEKTCLGCVYIDPGDKIQYDAYVYYWVRDSEKVNGLDQKIGKFIRKWLSDSWPFQRPVFPGRDFSWEDWALYLETGKVGK